MQEPKHEGPLSLSSGNGETQDEVSERNVTGKQKLNIFKRWMEK